MARKTRGKRNFSVGCLVLFALPFAGVGVGMGVMVARTLVDHVAMRSWAEVPARIVAAKLDVSSGDGDTYRTTATYVYTYAGRQYTGQRVSLHGGSDNIGTFHQRVHAELSRHQKSGEPFRCYVDPDNPDEAVLYRDLRWEMLGFYLIFVLLFGSFGFGMLIGGLIDWRKSRGAAAAAAERPEEPWLWKPDCAAGRIRSSNKAVMYFLIGFACFWIVISSPIWFMLPAAIGRRDFTEMWLVIFPIVGIGLAVAALVAVLHRLRYGESTFEMAKVPGVVGGILARVVRVPVKVTPREGFRVTLSCVQIDTGGESTSKTVFWEDEQTIACELLQDDREQSAVPVLFGIPYDQPETSCEQGTTEIVWRLAVKADEPGFDYSASFDVPIFKTPGSDPDFQPDKSALAPYLALPDPEADLARAGVIKTPSPDGPGTRYVFPAARHLGMILGFTLFVLIWSAVIAGMIYLGAGILFPIGFGLFGLLFVYFAADLWCYQSTIDVFGRQVVVSRGYLGLVKTKRLDIDKIEKVFHKESMRSGNTAYYDVHFDLGDGKKALVGKRIKTKPLADAVVRELEAALRAGVASDGGS